MKKIKNIALGIAVMLIASYNTPLYFRFKPLHKGIDSTLKPYIESFIIKSQGSINEQDFDNLTVGFRKFKGKDADRIAGLCFYSPFFREIDINIEWWRNTPDQLMREELVFHELGHCVLNRIHTSPTQAHGIIGWFERLFFELGIFKDRDFLSDGCPVSYMHPKTISSFCIYKHYNYYINELYKKEKENFIDYKESRAFIKYKKGHGTDDCK